VELAGGDEDRLAGLDRKQVQYEGGEGADVARKQLHEAEDPLERALATGRYRAPSEQSIYSLPHTGEQVELGLTLGRYDTVEEHRELDPSRVPLESVADLVILRRTEGADVLDDLGDGAEAAEELEAREGDRALGLAIRVPVVALGGADGRAAQVLPLEAEFGLPLARVRLDGEGRSGGESLEQEGQLGTEAAYAARSEAALGIPRNELVQADGFAVDDYLGRRLRMRAHPQLGEGAAAGVGQPERLGDTVDAAPSVALDRIVESV
jgi:hypothetical protein